MHIYLIIGNKRTGKSRYTKSRLMLPPRTLPNGKKMRGTINDPCYVFDKQNEYGESYYTNIGGKDVLVTADSARKLGLDPPVGLATNKPVLPRSRLTGKGMDMNYFLDVCLNKKGTNIVIEEATIFFTGRVEEKTRQLVIDAYHTGNNLFFVFHSILSVPPFLMTQANYVILFPTRDNIKEVYQKYGFPELVDGFKRMAAKKDKRKPEFIALQEITG